MPERPFAPRATPARPASVRAALLVAAQLVAVLAPAAGLSTAWANVPSAYLACAGANDGDACTRVGPEYGSCVLDTLCSPNPDLAVNNCLLCVDPCWGQADNTACVRRDGAPGVCVLQDRCTDDPFKSFSECNRCVEGEVEVPGAGGEDDGGCSGLPVTTRFGRWGGPALLPWLGVLLGLGWQVRRARRR